MKKIIILFVLFLSGCAWIDGGYFTYRRFGNQEINDLVIDYETSSGGEVKAHVELGQQKSEREFAETLEKILQIVEEIRDNE